MLSSRAAFLKQRNTTREFLINCWGVKAAETISLTYCSQRSVLISGPRHSRIMLRKSDKERFSPCAILRYAKFLLAKMNASTSFDCWLAFWRQWYGWEKNRFAEQILPCLVLCCVNYCTARTVNFAGITCFEGMIFRTSTSRRSFLLGFLCWTCVFGEA